MPPVKKSSNNGGRKKRNSSATKEHGGGNSQFVRVVFSPVSQGLRFPTDFMKDYGHSFNANTVVTLNVPTGASWPVHLRQADTGLWLGQGWEEFAEYYSIEVRHFLMFKYQGSAQFSVIIMEPSGLEIEYPMDVEDEDEAEAEAEDVIDMDFYENAGRNDAAGVTIAQGEKKKYASYQKAEGFKSENPFSLSFMQPSYVSDRFILAMNWSSIWDFLPKDTGSKVTVKVGVDGSDKVWTMMNWNVYRRGRKTTVATGWKEFVVDNHLRVGDVCAFELVNPKDLHFKVTIFRNT